MSLRVRGVPSVFPVGAVHCTVIDSQLGLVRLPEPGGLGQFEPRGALWVAVEIDGIEVQIVNTHLGLLPGERRVQADALLGNDWLGGMPCGTPRILCGDFNAIPSSPVYRRLTAQLQDSQTVLAERRPRKTFFGRYPTARIDHVFVGPGIEVLGVEVPSTHTARVASDHLPLVVDLLISGAALARSQ